jgi:hypothetical protein
MSGLFTSGRGSRFTPISAGLGLVIALMPPLLHGSGGIDNHSRSYLLVH